MPAGFELVHRSKWGARRPRSRTLRSAQGVNTVYIHWPGHPGQLSIPDSELIVPEQEATDCLLTPQILARASRIDTPAEERAFMRQIQNFHMDVRRWSDFAYNYAVFKSGRVYSGRTFKVVPASQAPYNTSGVSICCMLGTADSVPESMRIALIRFTRWCERYARHDLHAKGHRQVNQTTCPGDPLMRVIPRLDRI